MTVIREFRCPKCGSSMYGSSELPDGKLMRQCHGDERRPCKFKWHQDDDDKYFVEYEINYIKKPSYIK